MKPITEYHFRGIGAFVKGWLVQKNIALVQEMAESIDTKITRGNIIMKLNMEKSRLIKLELY